MISIFILFSCFTVLPLDECSYWISVPITISKVWSTHGECSSVSWAYVLWSGLSICLLKGLLLLSDPPSLSLFTSLFAASLLLSPISLPLLSFLSRKFRGYHLLGPWVLRPEPGISASQPTNGNKEQNAHLSGSSKPFRSSRKSGALLFISWGLSFQRLQLQAAS